MPASNQLKVPSEAAKLQFSTAMTTTGHIENFSYATPDDPRLKRLLIRAVEKMTGQPYLKRLYDEHRANPVPGESFWAAAIRQLELKITCNEEALHQLPSTGP